MLRIISLLFLIIITITSCDLNDEEEKEKCKETQLQVYALQLFNCANGYSGYVSYESCLESANSTYISNLLTWCGD